ncbi:sugar phosphate isomerase/epimerase family protein [Actinoalloteichus spitiensis]|uniref:sugar phosphate isomerase/epimerase family protein n=1 Tax=Actinoalloteichus spitiensis TaxID=252394 RepID=UPI000374C909|nr:sugar phosphate isomerase/epimerase family protein [Actinoalloteichus spitiensis]
MFALGANTWIWGSPLDDGMVAALLPRLAAWGFDAVELPVEQPGDFDPGRAAEVLAERGLGCAAVIAVMSEGRDLVTAGADVEATRGYLRHCVDVAVRLGSGVVGGPTYAPVGVAWRMDPDERAEVYARLRTGLRPVVDYAAERGVVLAVEPLNRYETSVVNTVEQALTALRGLPEEAVGLMVDTYHLNIEERSLPGAVHAAGRRIAHVQVCANDRGTPGADHLDWAGFLGALRDVGYRGALCVESFTAHTASIARAASVWRPLAESQDALAVEGLAFLRGALTRLGTGTRAGGG